MVNIIQSLFQKLDDMSLQLRAEVTGFNQALREGNRLCTTESSLGTASGVSYLSYYLAAIPNAFNRISKVFKIHVGPFSNYAMSIADSIPLPIVLFGLGFVASGFKFFKEGLSLYRQQQFLSTFEKHAWKEPKVRNILNEIIVNFDKQTFKHSLPPAFLKEIEKRGGKAYLERLSRQPTVVETDQLLSQWTGKNMREALEEIKNLSASSLERALPEWLFEDITHKGGKDYLNILLKKVYKGDRQATAEGTKLLETMRSYATKKKILHILGMVAAAIGIIGCIGFLVTFPFLLSVALLVAISLLGLTAYVVRRGYVENRDDNFSFDKLLPAFMQPSYVPKLTPQNLLYVPKRKQYGQGVLRSFHFQSRKGSLQYAPQGK